MGDGFSNENEEQKKQVTTKDNIELNHEVVVKRIQRATLDSLGVIKTIWSNPTNGLEEVLLNLTEDQSFNAGMLLCIVFVIFCWLTIINFLSHVLRIINIFSGTFRLDSSFEVSLQKHLFFILASSIPLFGMVLILWLIKKTLKTKGDFKKFTLVTGVAFFPITLFLIVLLVLGNTSSLLVTLVGFFCFTTFILLINSAFMGVLKLSSRNSLIMVPALIIADLFFVNTVLGILL